MTLAANATNAAPAVPAPSRHALRAWLGRPMAVLKRKLSGWWLSRLPLTDRLTLTQRNVYILPTRPGLMLGVTLLVLLVASINYQLNLGYLLTFLLAGCAVVAMHVSHGNLRGLTLHLIAPEPVFAWAKASFHVTLHNPRRSTRHALAISVDGTEQWVWTDVGAQASSQVQLAMRAPTRGLHPMPALNVHSLFPLGTFRVWALWRPAAQWWVYPAPESHPPPLPMGQARPGELATGITHGPDEPDGLRPYRAGDTLKHIVWKKVAQTGELISRDHHALQAHHLWLDMAHTGLSGQEAQISRLCAWVLAADAKGLRFGLRLPAHDVPPASGPAHLQRCLQLLASA